jgi:hypothetical protein
MRAAYTLTLASLLCGALVQPTTARASVVICQKGKTLKLRRDGCKKKETPVAASELGVAGPAGMQGSEGEQGAQGPAGPAGTATAEGVFTAFCALEPICECPAGGRLLSGGVSCPTGAVKQGVPLTSTRFTGLCDVGPSIVGVTCLGRSCETAADCPGHSVCDSGTNICQCEDENATGADCISIRLVPGPREGRLEVFHEMVWGTVCDDGWEDENNLPSAQGQLNAAVACRQLGLGPPTAIRVAGENASDLAERPILMDETLCTGTESSLTSCSFAGFGNQNCGHDEDVGLACAPPP